MSKDNNLKERIKYNPNLSYRKRLADLFIKGTWDDVEDLDKLLVGAILEQKKASKDLMSLFKKSDLTCCANGDWETELGKNFKQFLVPQSYYAKTRSGILKRLKFLYDSIDAYTSYDNESVYCIHYITTGTMYNFSARQRISINGNTEEITFSYNKSLEDRDKFNNYYNHKKELTQKNGQDISLKEHCYYSKKHYPQKSSYDYKIKRLGGVAEISIGKPSWFRHNKTGEFEYEQIAPNSFLNYKQGLGWFEQNTNARQLFYRKITLEELNKRLKSQRRDRSTIKLYDRDNTFKS